MIDHIDNERLIDYHFDLLEGDDKEAVTQHLESCSSCQDAFNQVKSQFGQLDLIKDDEEALADGLLEAIKVMADEHVSKPSLKPKPFPRWVGVILTAAACLAIAAFIFYAPNPPTKNQPLDLADTKEYKHAGDEQQDPVPNSNAASSELAQREPMKVAEAEGVSSTADGSMQQVEADPAAHAELQFKASAITESVRSRPKDSRIAKAERGRFLEQSGSPLASKTKDAERLGAAPPRMAMAEAQQSAAPREAKARPEKAIVVLDMDQPYFEPGSNIELNVLPRRDHVQMTIYNAEDLTLIRERRKLTMKKGWNWLQYMWKNTLIDPTSLELKPVDAGDRVTVTQLVFPPRMTGVGRWLIHSKVSGLVDCEITYFTSGVSWRAFYEGTLNEDETSLEFRPYVRIDNGSGETYENAQTRLVVGMVNLDDYISDLARRKFPYGNPSEFGDSEFAHGDSVVLDSIAEEMEKSDAFGADEDDFGGGAAAKEIMKEGLSEYQLFTVEGRETIADKWGKRLQSMAPVTVPVSNLYKYDEDRWSDHVIRFVSFKNDKDHKLGQSPLPGGNVRLYGSAGNGLSYVGSSDMKYIPVDEDIELELGHTPKVKVEPKLMKTTTLNHHFDKWGNVDGWDKIDEWTITMNNTRPVPVDLEITRNFESESWDIELEKGADYKKHDTSHGRFTVTLKAFETKVSTYKLTRYYGVNRK